MYYQRATLYVGLAHVVPPLIQNSSLYFTRLKRVYRTQTPTSREHHISSLHSHSRVQLSACSAFPQPEKNGKFLRFFVILRGQLPMEYQVFLNILCLLHSVPLYVCRRINFQDLCASLLGDTSLCIRLLTFISRFAIDFLSI